MIEKSTDTPEKVHKKKLRYIEDFLQIVKFTNVSTIHNFFNDDVDRFVSAQFKFVALNKESESCFPMNSLQDNSDQILADAKNTFFYDLTVKDLSRIFTVGTYVDGKFKIFPQYWNYVENLINEKRVYSRNSGHVLFKRNRRIFILPTLQLKEIFEDKDLVEKICNFDDSVFTSRQRDIIMKTFPIII